MTRGVEMPLKGVWFTVLSEIYISAQVTSGYRQFGSQPVNYHKPARHPPLLNECKRLP